MLRHSFMIFVCVGGGGESVEDLNVTESSETL